MSCMAGTYELVDPQEVFGPMIFYTLYAKGFIILQDCRSINQFSNTFIIYTNATLRVPKGSL